MSDLSAICAACGACCDGTLFDVVPVDADEAPRVAARGLDVFPRDDASDLVIAEPCVAHGPAGCGVYADRPRACAAYVCRLLADVASGASSFDAARSFVTETRALADDLRARVGTPHLGLRRAIELACLERTGDAVLFADAAELGARLDRLAE